MSDKIGSFTEVMVRHNWLKGLSRDENAEYCGISSGSVSNIVKKFIDSPTGYDIAAIRDFVVKVRKENLSINECALGYRFASILGALGISDDDNQLRIFINDAYEISKQLDSSPTIMQDCLLELIRIAKVILPSRLGPYLQQQKEDKENLEEELKNIKEEIINTEKARSGTEKNFIRVKKEIGITSAELDWFTNIKYNLEKEGLDTEDLSFLTKTISTIKKYTFSELFEIIQKINELENLNNKIEEKEKTLNMIQIDIETMKGINSRYSEVLNSKALIIDNVEKIEKLGIEIKDWIILKQVLNVISFENDYNINPSEIKDRFFEILSQYRENRYLEKEKERLEYLVSELDKEVSKNRSVLLSQGSIGVILRNLLNKGLTENDIITVKIYVDTLKNNNINLEFINNPTYPLVQLKSNNIKENNEFYLFPPQLFTNAIFMKNFDPNLEKHNNNTNKPIYFQDDEAFLSEIVKNKQL